MPDNYLVDIGPLDTPMGAYVLPEYLWRLVYIQSSWAPDLGDAGAVVRQSGAVILNLFLTSWNQEK